MHSTTSHSSASTKTAPTYHVAVVGGGLAGKSTALLLAQQGLKVALLAPPSAAQEGAWDSRIYAFSRSSQALLEKLRVWSALDAKRIEPVRDMKVFGDQAGQLHFSAYGAALTELAWIVEQRLLEQTLDAALRFAHQVALFPCLATALTIDETAAHLSLADGRSVSAECVVGADGALSWVRQQAGISASAHPYQQLGVVANFALEKPHHGTAYQWFMGGRGTHLTASTDATSTAATSTDATAGDATAGDILALLPLPDGQVSMVWSAHTALAQQLLALSPEALCDAVQGALDGAVGAVTGALRCVTPAQGFPLVQRQAAQWVKPRLALVGDAAHVIHPLAGQGMNLGLRDVAELGAVLAAKEAFRDYGDWKLLRRYERARKGDAALMGATMRGLHGLFAQTGVLPSALRNLGMQAISTMPAAKQFFIRRALG